MFEERRAETLTRKPARNSSGGESRESIRRPPAPTVKKGTPPDQTNAEQFYYAKQMQGKTQMVVVLEDGEELHGVIEWYDRDCLKLNRIGAPNLLLYKRSIKYMYKAEPE
jgi:sRNA-binding regulator protein Hfq